MDLKSNKKSDKPSATSFTIKDSFFFSLSLFSSHLSCSDCQRKLSHLFHPLCESFVCLSPTYPTSKARDLEVHNKSVACLAFNRLNCRAARSVQQLPRCEVSERERRKEGEGEALWGDSRKVSRLCGNNYEKLAAGATGAVAISSEKIPLRLTGI